MNPQPHIERLVRITDEAFVLLTEYYESVGVIVRDTREYLESLVQDRDGGFWLASLHGEAQACVVLRPLSSIEGAGEVKRLFVRPQARGHGLASLLMNELEDYARAFGYTALYLDSKDDLREAIALYERRGYFPCERYNDNPQATVFLRKFLG